MPMLLRDQNGDEFELAIIGDRLPEAQDGFGDDETATVSWRVIKGDQEWEETSPNLGLVELHMLADWLTALGQADPGAAELDLLAEELNFSVVAEQGEWLALRIAFTLPDRPERFTVDAPTDEASHVDLKVSRFAVRAAAAQLREDLAAPRGAGKDDITGEEDLGGISPGVDDPHAVVDESSGQPGRDDEE